MLPESPLQFLREELQAESVADVVKALKRVKYVAAAVEAEKTRDALLPLLQEIQKQTHDDEVLFTLAEELFVLSDFIGGPEYYHLLLPQLQSLAAQEETVVREKAVESIVKILYKKHTDRNRLVRNYIMGIIESLSRSTEWFTSRVSVCGLLTHAYKFASASQKAELRSLYQRLASDETPMVRRAAVVALKDLAPVVEKNVCTQTLLLAVQSFANDVTQASIRAAAVEALVSIARRFTPEENESAVLPLVIKSSEDQSWKVRIDLARNFPELVKAFGGKASTCLLGPFHVLLKDTAPTAEVKVAAIEALSKFIKYINANDFVSKGLLNTLVLSAGDLIPTVRTATSSALGELCKCVNRHEARESLLPVVLTLMKDEVFDVRLNMVSHSADLIAVLGTEPDSPSQKVVDTITSLMSDAQWRIRLAVIEQIPKLAQIYGVEGFKQKLEPLYFKAFDDKVHAVRQKAVEDIKALGDTFGFTWAAESLLPKVLERYDRRPSPTTESRNIAYLTRICVLHALPYLAQVIPSETVETVLVPLFLRGMRDTVPNVRFAAASISAELVRNRHVSQTTFTRHIEPALHTLCDDEDADVQYFAKQALRAIPVDNQSRRTSARTKS